MVASVFLQTQLSIMNFSCVYQDSNPPPPSPLSPEACDSEFCLIRKHRSIEHVGGELYDTIETDTKHL